MTSKIVTTSAGILLANRRAPSNRQEQDCEGIQEFARGAAPGDAPREKLRRGAPRSKNRNYSYNRASDEKQPQGDDSYDIASISGF